MNKLYYMALGLGLAFSLAQTSALAQAWQDAQPQVSAAPSSQPTINGGGQQTFFTSKQQLPSLPITRMGGMANGSAAGQGTIPSGQYSFGFSGGGPSYNGGYTSLPPTATSSCLGINILGGDGGGTGMGGVDSGAGAVGAAASTSPSGVGGAASATTGSSTSASGF